MVNCFRTFSFFIADGYRSAYADIDRARETIMTGDLPPSTLEIALLKAVEQARAGHQLEIAVSLSMMLESLRRQNDEPPADPWSDQGPVAQA